MATAEAVESEAEANATGAAQRNAAPGSPEQEAALQAYRDAYQRCTDAKGALRTAQRSYDSTPRGQRELDDQIANETASNPQAWKTQELKRRKAEGAQLRREQVVALEHVTAHQERLDAASPEEKQYLEDLNVTADRARSEHAAAQAAATETEQQINELRPLLRADDEQSTSMHAAYAATLPQVQEATRPVRAEAIRLYTEAGVNPRMASYYADDMVEGAKDPAVRQGRPGLPGRPDQAVPVRPLRMKIKRSGPDKAKTEAAYTASLTDPAFKSTNEALKDACARRASAHTAWAAHHGSASRTTLRESQRALQAEHKTRQEAVAAAAQRAEAAQEQIRHGRARIRAAAGVDAANTEWTGAGRAIARNPDGTTNAWVYREPSEGHPDGRYMRATGVTRVHGMSPANALVVEDGRTAHLAERYSRSRPGGGQTSRSHPGLLLVGPPAPGAVPLRDECEPQAGYTTFVDSTD